MSENEVLDQVNEQGNVIGKAPRHVFHSNPQMIHPVVHCWLFNKSGQILWQQRSMSKAISPGEWDMSCGGHILSGDDPFHTINKELEEELGLTNVDVKLVEKHIGGNNLETELVYLFYGIVEVSIKDLKLQEAEVEKVEWIDPYKAQELILNGSRKGTDSVFTQVTKILRHLAFPN